MDNIDFDFSLLNIDSTLKTSLGENLRCNKPMEQCQLCQKLRKTFYCKNCVKNGDFIHSTSRFSERFAEKRLALLRMYNEKEKLNKEFDKNLSKIKLKEDKMEEIRVRKEKIVMLQILLMETKKKVIRRRKIYEDLNTFNKHNKEELKKNEACHDELKQNRMKLKERQPIFIQKLMTIKPDLKVLIRKRIEELVQFIFPINEVEHSKSIIQIDDSHEDIKNKLADASKTAFVRGRWIFTESWGEMQHSVVAPTLPASGDYTQYIKWVSADKDNALAMTSSSDVEHNPAYNLSAALTYTTQMVNIIAYFLDIRLPNKLLYSEFCEKPLNEWRFMKCVTYLNANVLYLCLSQKVNGDLLKPAQTVKNLLLLLDHEKCDLGRKDIIDLDTTHISLFEEQLNQQVRSATTKLSFSEGEEDDHDILRMENINNEDDEEYDSDHLPTDWEAVPLVSCPEAQPGPNTVRRPILNAAQTSSIAGGLVTSAAASLASMWRGWSANR